MSYPIILTGKKKYKLGKPIGEGQYGTVYDATVYDTTDYNNNKKVAIKKLKTNTIFNKTLLQEINNQQSITHPNVLKIHEVINTQYKLYIVLDIVYGQDLFYYIKTHGQLSINNAGKMFKQLICAIEACHKVGIVHRDIKLENILIQGDTLDLIILADFGLSAAFIDNDGNKLKLTQRCGSTKYAAPELFNERNTEYIPELLDIWSSAIVLFASVNGYFPFTKTTNKCNLFELHQQNKYKFPSDFSNNLIELLSGMLTIDPEERWTIPQIKSSAWCNNLNLNINNKNKNNISPDCLLTTTKKESTIKPELSISWSDSDSDTEIKNNNCPNCSIL